MFFVISIHRNEEFAMDNLDKVRARQKSKSEKETKRNKRSKRSASSDILASGVAQNENSRSAHTRVSGGASSQGKPKRRRRRKSKYAWIFTTLKILFLVMLACAIGVGIWVFSMIDFTFGDDLSSMNLNISSKVYYTNAAGEAVKYAQFDATENRIWVSIDKMPKNLINAFVSIEDQRFFKHKGVDLKRTAGAALNYITKGDSSYGGSTITQQLVKNITRDDERTSSRKLREILRSLVLETKLSKEQILEMYLNTIYLGQGANGVEAAANTYFSKDVSELNLTECACIAGITQLPAKYDPILEPEANKEKRLTVLGKMLELGCISKDEYDTASKEEIKLNVSEINAVKIQSYFLDQLFEELQDDLVKKGYTEEFAANMIYNGGLKIYSTVDPDIQETMEDYFEDSDNFPKLSGDVQPQAAMVISEPSTGEIKGIVGGRGQKDRNRGLNRATQSKRQPGSSIKPLAVYAPAIDMGVVTPSSYVDDSPLDIDGWRPKNSGGKFRGYVSVETAVTWSYNIPAVRVLEGVGVDKSFDYMKNKLHIDSLVTSRNVGGDIHSDKNLSALALGGLTDGVTVMEMNTAYSALANGGKYIEPHMYTKVYDVEGKLLLTKEIKEEQVFRPSTAYIVSNMLKKVVQSGTGSGAKISGIDTCGKTGTTDDNKDRWFIGYTPYLCGSVWFGYDKPKAISYGGNNPALTIWDNIMTKLHADMPEREFEQPDDVDKISVCRRTGKAASSGCTAVTQYADVNVAKEKCKGSHEYIGTKPYMSVQEYNGDDEEESKPSSDGGDNQNKPVTDTPEGSPSHGDTPSAPAEGTSTAPPQVTEPANPAA